MSELRPEEVITTTETVRAVPDQAPFIPQRSNSPKLGGKVGLAALSAITGGVLTWAAISAGGLGAAAPAPAAPQALGELHDGTYVGSIQHAGAGELHVTVTVAGGRITNIDTAYPDENPTSAEINADAVPRLVSEAIETQSANVHMIAGATGTSTAFIGSLQDALNQATTGVAVEAAPVAPGPEPIAGMLQDGTFTGPTETFDYGEVAVTITVANGSITHIESTYPEDHPRSAQINEEAVPQLIAEAIETQDAGVTLVSGATFTSHAFNDSLQGAINQAQARELEDGTFTGAAGVFGPGNEVIVTITVAGGEITDVSTVYPTGSDESREINERYIPQLEAETKERQNANLSMITGATGTVGAFKESLQDALNQASH